jgi:hypothetical protein
MIVTDINIEAPPLEGEGFGWVGLSGEAACFINVHPSHEQVRITPRSEPAHFPIEGREKK